MAEISPKEQSWKVRYTKASRNYYLQLESYNLAKRVNCVPSAIKEELFKAQIEFTKVKFEKNEVY